MDKKQISEDAIRKVLTQVLNEEISKVKREEYTRLLFKLDDIEKSLSDLIRELHKVDDTTATGLKVICKDKFSLINSNLLNTHRLLLQLKDRVRQKRKSQSNFDFNRQLEERKKKK